MISGQPTIQTYNCDGSRDFRFPFRIIEAGDVRVQREEADGAIADLDPGKYVVAGVGDDAGVTVTTDEAYVDGKIRVWLRLEAVQPNTYENNTPFPAQSHEDGLDRMTLLNAMRREEFARTIRAPFGRGGLELPPAAQMAGRLWASDADGSLSFVPTIKGDDMLTIDAASIYFDYNYRAEPQIVLDVAGKDGAAITGVNQGGFKYGVIGLQDDVALVNDGMQRVYLSSVFRGQHDGTPLIDNKHSRFMLGVNVRSEIDAVHDDVKNAWMPQEVGGLVVSASAGTGTSRAKVEGIVVSAKEEAGLAVGSKGVAVQAITVRTTQGPSADDRGQISDVEDGPDGNDVDEPTDGSDGSRLGSFTIRCNGGTVKVDGQPVYGGWRSWSVLLAGGRAGYFNGIVMSKRHGSGSYTDPESVGGWGGIWGGRSFWHENTFAVRCTDAKPGWIAGGKDEPAYPCDIVSATVATVPGRAYAVDGTPVVGARKTGWGAATGTPSRATFDTATVTTAQLAQRLKALLDDLGAATGGHGLIGS